jgi:predicted PurR-regulated permease PerM
MIQQPAPAMPPVVPPLTALMTPRLRRWLTALVILFTLATAFFVVDYVGKWLMYFGDVIMIFFLAWLLAFILSPVANGLLHLIPRLPRSLAVIIVYALLIVILVVAAIWIATSLYNSISALLSNWPSGTAESDQHLRDLLAPYQNWLNSIGASQINLFDQVKQLLDNLKNGANNLVQPLSGIAFATVGVFGNLLFVFFLSLYMAVDRDHIVSFLFRIVPPNYTDEARLLEHSVARSFGGFLRGQAFMGLMYGLISAACSLLLGLPYVPVTATASGVLQAIPFFGPFVSWAPPVLVAVFFEPDVALPALIIMGIGWFVLMNIVQPRLMSEAVGLHPVVVLGSVLIGTKIAGIPGAIFAIPVAAVISAFFFYYLGHPRADAQPVAVRAAHRVEAREGRPIRVPRLPRAGEDGEVE